MKADIVEVRVNTAYGKKLDSPLSADVPVELFESAAEVKEQGQWPNDAAILDFINGKIVANTRQATTQQLLKDAGFEKPNAENSEDVRLATMVKMIRLSKPGLSEADAIAAAKTLL